MIMTSKEPNRRMKNERGEKGQKKERTEMKNLVKLDYNAGFCYFLNDVL